MKNHRSKCPDCGQQLETGALFCSRCGARQTLASGRKKGKGVAIAGAAVLIVAAGIAAAAIFLPEKGDSLGMQEPVMADNGESGARTEEESASGEVAMGATSEAVAEEAVPADPLYSITDVPWIDITAMNYTAGAKQPGMIWDRNLFYWLEDTNTESAEDGNIARCRVSKTLLRDAQSGKLRQYEIYSDPTNGAIYKIVSIEEIEGGLSLVDYYYKDGRPNFIFQRDDTVYTPTYATIEKIGERFYFNEETLVRWRMIREPGVIGEYTLTAEETWYSQGDYFAESDELRGIYDETEQRMLNAAHNTYDAIVSGGYVGMVQGYLQDTVGSGIAGKRIGIYRASDDTLLYETTTDEGGQYAFFVYLDDTECYIRVAADELYKETMVQGMRFTPASVTYAYGLTMHKNSGDEYPVTFCLYSCMDVASDGDETIAGAALQTATATVREGAGNYHGEAFRTAETQAGELAVNLPSGVYTVQFHTEGYLDSYMEVEVAEAAAARDVYVMPSLAETQTGVILAWDGDAADLDLTLFTPYQAESGDMDHIGGVKGEDGHGNILVSDNKSRCEVMFINSGEPGSYKLYVNNYTDSTAGSYASDALSRLNVHIYIYNSSGFVAEYTVPVGQAGVVWEVAEINGRTVTPAQRVYKEISGKSWWLENKNAYNAEEDAALLAYLEAEYSPLRELMYGMRRFMSSEEINALLRGEKEGIEAFFLLDDNDIIGPAARCVADETGGVLPYDNAYGSLLKKEAADYLIYSVCGKRIEFDYSAYERWVEPDYINLDGVDGDSYDVKVEHFSVERVDANTWDVRAKDVCYGIESYLSLGFLLGVVSDVRFTVIKNPDSCLGGYSLTDFAVEKTVEPSEWAKTYYDYLTTDPEGIAIYQNLYRYNLIYLDDDLIPEIYIESSFAPAVFWLLHLVNGRAVVEEMYGHIAEMNYVPYTGLLKVDAFHLGQVWQDNYKLENGSLTELGGWLGHSSNIDPETGELIELPPDEPVVDIIDEYHLNYSEVVTKEQYEEMIGNCVGTVEFLPCFDETDAGRGYRCSLLEALQTQMRMPIYRR